MTRPFEFHDGELSVQARAGEAAVASRNARLVSDAAIPGALAFIRKQRMVVISNEDSHGHVWASVVFGAPGFLSASSERTIRMEGGLRGTGDPVGAHVTAGSHLGMLFIELETRRRYRVNGVVSAVSEDGLDVEIQEAYPNCPKYIQRRQLRDVAAATGSGTEAVRGAHLTPDLAALIAGADTFFVGSMRPGGDSDVSHRGGHPGFVGLLDASTLRIPDYHGNSLFNTLGNLSLHPECGLVIPDFQGQRLLHLSGTALLRWDLDDHEGRTGGTRRFWDFHIREWLLRPLPAALEWDFVDASPFNPAAS
ncbi:pyridoxamine 5'-phosphate oxidase family protein [Variovorax sp. IB41]|uniref:pyridoxamine 5'-phosphate oxidase family protein n=1 Tax=Variovorax sp. IB41 TaxID=2779370 RepID=UPI0018E7D616|nr:pyridoxamine 5'-phosphate oxidase family protein [Variovorax sp. IB41]MBJ2154286.1 pyridoxamine 5'-phosphate oxidase family protein [Variovorax sp. IB41]